jgi:hypothetical protein
VIVHTDAWGQQNIGLAFSTKDVEHESNVGCKRDAANLNPDYAIEGLNVSPKKQNRDGGEPRHQKIQQSSKTHRNIHHKFRRRSLPLAPTSPSETPLQNLVFHLEPGIFSFTDYHQGSSVGSQYGLRNALQEERLVIVQVPAVNLNQAQLA